MATNSDLNRLMGLPSDMYCSNRIKAETALVCTFFDCHSGGGTEMQLR